MWKQVGSGLRASIASIAEEAAATVAELREAHNHQSWERLEEKRPTSSSVTSQFLQGGQEGSNADDISVRLAAIKAKLSSDKDNTTSIEENDAEKIRRESSLPSASTTELSEQSGGAEKDVSQAIGRDHTPDIASNTLYDTRKSDILVELSKNRPMVGNSEATAHQRQREDNGEVSSAWMNDGANAVGRPSKEHDIMEKKQSEMLRENQSALSDGNAGNVDPDAVLVAEQSAALRCQSIEKELLQTKSELESYRSHAKDLTSELRKEKDRIEYLEQLSAQKDEDGEKKLNALQEECALLQENLKNINMHQEAEKDSKDAMVALKGENSELKRRVEDVNGSLEAVQKERDSLKQQLARLKAQMLDEQEDEEEKIRWRVEAEVKMALEKAAASHSTTSSSELSRARAETSAALERAKRAEEEAARWEEKASSKDVELANMQRALGELSFESDTAERLRGEVRAKQAEIHRLKKSLEEMAGEKEQVQNDMNSLRKQLDKAIGETKIAREAEVSARKEALEALSSLETVRREMAKLKDKGDMYEKSSVIEALVEVSKYGRSGRKAAMAAAQKLSLDTAEVEAVVEAERKKRSENGGTSLSIAFAEFLEKEAHEIH